MIEPEFKRRLSGSRAHAPSHMLQLSARSLALWRHWSYMLSRIWPCPKRAPVREEMMAVQLMNAWMEDSRARAVGALAYVHLLMLMADGTHRRLVTSDTVTSDKGNIS